MKTKIKDVQKCCLKLLKEFIRVATKYQLTWFADGGTLLGAIRNGKMIPWDDDIDIVMPRKDFNVLLKIGPFEFKNKYFFQTFETDEIFQLCAKLRLNNTIGMTKNEYYTNCHKGIFIDIFPLDYITHDSMFEYEKQMLRSTKYIEKSNILDSNKKRIECLKYNDILTTFSNFDKERKFVGEMILYRYSKYKDIDVRISSNAYDNYFLIKFKGLKKYLLRIPIGYDEILRKWYGDNYLIPTNESSLHGITFYDTKHGIDYYKQYKYISFDEFCKSNDFTIL